MGNINKYLAPSVHQGVRINTRISSTSTSLEAKKDIMFFDDKPFPNPDMKGLANYDDGSLKDALANATAEQEAAVKTIAAAADKWEEAAYWKLLLNAESLRRRHKPYKADKPNVWVDMSNYRKQECIENSLYRMTVAVKQWSEHDIRVNWNVYIIYPNGVSSPQHWSSKDIAGQSMKKFTSMDAAMKYVEGRKKAYSHLFIEEMPPVPQKYLQLFKVFGVLLPGYRAEKSAADMKGGNKSRKTN